MSRTTSTLRRSIVAVATPLVLVSLAACGDAKTDSVQVGYRGTAMEQNYDHGDLKAKFAAVKIPAPLPPAGASPPGPLPWKNVQVLNDISVGEFNRTMVAMSTWVAGTGNCAYCHNIANMASDTLPNGKPLYTKLVARRMLQMTRQINGQYSQHVKNTGVTCYTCHMGKPLPNGLWFYSSQTDYLRHYLDRDGARVVSREVAPSNMNRSSVKQTEWTYALMMSQSSSLGVNCTYCHNSRQFASWKEAPPARVTAYHGILMLRDVNQNYLAPLQPVYPAVRLGQQGDAPKAQCVTCHNGAYKPLYGAQMVKHYPALWGRAEWNGLPFPGLGPTIDSLAPMDSATKSAAPVVPAVKASSSRSVPAAAAMGAVGSLNQP
ncbi:MAG: photosynthetic reaction center cytochrome PufC [Gemmatimonadota bacterium]|nr:photosynthetic reaction center cytochrome PufC [Gemmatimonadota bacterium]